MWKRRRLKKRPAVIKILLGSCAVLVVILVYFIILKPGLFTIKQVGIAMAAVECAGQNQLQAEAGLLGKSLLFISSSDIEKKLKKKFFCIKSLTVSKTLPDAVKLQILGRQPFAVLVNLKDREASMSSLIENLATPAAGQAQDTYILDNEGVVFAKDNREDIPKIYTYDIPMSLSNKLTSYQITNTLIILDKLKTLGINTRQGWVYDNDLLIDPANLGAKIIFRLDSDINIQLASLQLILLEAKIDLKEMEFIDLRFDKPVIKNAPKK